MDARIIPLLSVPFSVAYPASHDPRSICAITCESEIPKSRFGILDEHLQKGSPSSSLRVVEMGSSRRQLPGLCARSTAEFRVILVRTKLGLHDKFAVGEERVVLAMRMNKDA